MSEQDRSWPPMIWIGGSPGAGKSTLARKLATAYDLPLHPLDLWTYDHIARLPVGRPLKEDLARGPEFAAEAFAQSARARIELVVQDIRDRGLGQVPALVEGPQLFPSMAGGLPAGHAVWLVPDAEQTKRAREVRLKRVDDPAGRARLEGLLARDAVLAQRVRDEAAGKTLIEVPADPSWEAIHTALRSALALESVRRLAAGDELGRQRQIENLAACRQGRLWQADVGFDELPPYPFACECGRSGCNETWSGTPDQYDVRRGDGRLLAH